MVLGAKDKGSIRSFWIVMLSFFVSTTALGNLADHILVVGNNSSFDPALGILKYSEMDAKRFARAMALAGHTRKKNIHLLARPSLKEFKKELARIETTPSSKFIFYFSGHSDERGLHFPDGLFTKRDLHQFLESVNAQAKIAILDSCYSGALAVKGIEPAETEFLIPRSDYDEPTGTVFLTASSANEAAFESTKFEGSVFSYYLLSGIYGDADTNSDGAVTIEELYQHVYAQTRLDNLVLPARNQQKPEFVSDLKGHGALLVSLPSAHLQELTLAPELSGDFRLFSAYGLHSFFVRKVQGQDARVKLPPGRYKVSTQKGMKIGQADIQLQSNRPVLLAANDLSWQTIKMPSPTGTKGLSTTTLDTKRELGFELGAHSGHVENENVGPALSIFGTYSFINSRRWELRGIVGGHVRQSEIQNENGKARVMGLGTTLGLQPEFKFGFDTQKWQLLVAAGVGQLSQSWDSTHSTQGEEVASVTYRAIHPVYLLGLGTTIGTYNTQRIGMSLKREYIQVEDQFAEQLWLGATMLGVHFTY